jgi:orotidine-5'-phosphate decarboxylase
MPHEKIILAWDEIEWSPEDQILLKSLLPRVGAVKLGLATMTAEQSGVCLASLIRDFVHSEGGKVFWDAKFNDISTTVGKAVANASNSKVWGISIHTSAGTESLSSAVKHKGSSNIFGVTVLTSLSESESKKIFNREAKNVVIEFANILIKEKADGIICSPQELHALREHNLTSSLITIVPGIRPTWATQDDQQRILTPKEAVLAGADYIVIGRPITKPPNGMTPLQALDKIIEEIS